MAVKIRLARGGSKKRPYYRIVVADIRAPRDGKYIERVGSYNPLLPKDHEDSFNMLSTLSGNTHQVITGVALQLQDKNLDETFHEITNVTFKTLSDSDINYYNHNDQ